MNALKTKEYYFCVTMNQKPKKKKWIEKKENKKEKQN